MKKRLLDLLLSIAALLLVAKAGANPGLALNSNQLDQDCSSLLRDGTGRNSGDSAPPIPTNTSLLFRMFQSEISLKAYVKRLGDRIVLRLTSSPSDLQASPLSPDGKRAWRDFVQAPHHFSDLIAQIAREMSLSQQQLLDYFAIDGKSWMLKMLDARNNSNWTEVIRIYDKELTEQWKNLAEAKLQTALALNRRNLSGDRDRAFRLVDSVLRNTTGKAIQSEAAGIKARIFKDLYNETKDQSYLKSALDTYLFGFNANPVDYYPGTAYLELLFAKATLSSINEAIDFAPRVLWAIEASKKRLQAKNEPPNYWLLASEIQVLAVLGEMDKVSDLLPQAFANAAGSQNLQSTLDGFLRMQTAFEASGFRDRSIHGLIRSFQNQIKNPTGVGIITESSLSYVSPLEFPNMEGAFKTGPVNVMDELIKTGVEQLLRRASARGEVTVKTFHRFLQENIPQNAVNLSDSQKPVILAPTGPYKDVIEAIARQTGMSTWWEAYDKLGIPLSPDQTPQFIGELQTRGIPMVLFIPRNFQESHHLDSFTFNEFKLIIENFAELHDQTQFVLGFEDTFPLDYRNRVSEDFVRKNYPRDVMRFFLKEYQEWLQGLGAAVRDFKFGSEFTKSMYPSIYDEVLRQFPPHRAVREMHSAAMPMGTLFKKAKIADIGAGTGLVAEHLLQNSPFRDVHLFDPSPDMLDIAGQKQSIPPESIHLSSAQELRTSDGHPLLGSSLDGVVSNNMIYMLDIDEIRSLFKEVHRILKPGGRFTVSSMRDVEPEVHMSFIETARDFVRNLERQEKAPLGAANILFGSNQRVLNSTPTQLNFEQVKLLATAAGLVEVKNLRRETYVGSGFFMAFEKPLD